MGGRRHLLAHSATAAPGRGLSAHPGGDFFNNDFLTFLGLLFMSPYTQVNNFF